MAGQFYSVDRLDRLDRLSKSLLLMGNFGPDFRRSVWTGARKSWTGWKDGSNAREQPHPPAGLAWTEPPLGLDRATPKRYRRIPSGTRPPHDPLMLGMVLRPRSAPDILRDLLRAESSRIIPDIPRQLNALALGFNVRRFAVQLVNVTLQR